MNITQNFYNNMASQYDKLFLDWDTSVEEQAVILDRIFRKQGFDSSDHILDCACGIGTQAIGLAEAGYTVTGSDISEGALCEARARAAKRGVGLRFERADFCDLSKTFPERFDIVIAMDNALPHMLTAADLKDAAQSIAGRLREGGLFVASIRDYDRLLTEKPAYSAPYVHKTDQGQRVLFQTWDWHGANYRFIQYIIEDAGTPEIQKFECEYRAVRRAELTACLREAGFREVLWRMPEETGFYQPIVIARK